MRFGCLILAGAVAAPCVRAQAVDVELTAGNALVVVAKGACPVVRYAAAELTNYLSQTFGAPVRMSETPDDVCVNLILGENKWSRAAGLQPKTLMRDGFFSRVRDGYVLLVGRDDPTVDPSWTYTGRANLFGFERGTLNAVYDFLERHAETRFFFPGEHGTVVAHKDVLTIHQEARKIEPVFTERYYGWWNTSPDGWPDKSITMRRLQAVNWLRLRLGSSRLPCCVNAHMCGQPASAWGTNCVSGTQVGIMPEVGFKECFCAKCQTAYDGVPDFNLPPNEQQVMVATHGPWSAAMPEMMTRQIDGLRAWNEKLGHKVWLWTYSGKYGGKMKGVPEISPRAYAEFFSRAAPYAFGGYADNDTDRFMFEALNVYVFSRLAWNPQLDIEELLDDWHQRLFSRAADDMKRVTNLLERKWIGEVCLGRTITSAFGPLTVMPSSGQLWSVIYTPEVIARLMRLFESAASRVDADSPEARRITFFRHEWLDSLARQSNEANPDVELRRRENRRVRSLIANGDFDTDAGWAKSVPWGTAELDTIDRVTGIASAKLTSDERPHRESCVQSDFCVPVSLRKGSRYRLSYFIKLKDVVPYTTPVNGAGLCLWMQGNHYLRHPLPLLTGTCEWLHQSVVFTPLVDAPKANLQFRLEDALGTMWVDGVLLEDITDTDKGRLRDAVGWRERW